VFDVDAVDADAGANATITYLLLGPSISLFTMETATGIIRVSEVGLDFELINVIGNPLQFTLIAQDTGEPNSH